MPSSAIKNEGVRTSASAVDGFVVTVGDVEIFALLFEHRFLRCDHISALTDRSPKRAHRRLLKLLERGYLTVIRRPQQKHIYALGRASIPVLIEQGIAGPTLRDVRLRTHELKELFLQHEMMIVDLHVTLALALKAPGSPRLMDWREGRELHDTVVVGGSGRTQKLPFRPDAFFTLEVSTLEKRRMSFFLEADRSTMAHARLEEKMLAYWHYLEQGRHTRRLGIKSFRVLTLSRTPAREVNLCQMAASILPEWARKYFIFTSLASFSLGNPRAIMGRIYLSARDAGALLHPLIPANTFSPETGNH
jgi:Replication-relaxation